MDGTWEECAETGCERLTDAREDYNVSSQTACCEDGRSLLGTDGADGGAGRKVATMEKGRTFDREFG